MVQAFATWPFGTIRRMAYALLALACLAPMAFAQSNTQSAAYPTRPVRLLLGFAPGGATDVVARILQQSISEHLGQPLVIENRPGASGMIATQELVRATPGGLTYSTSGPGGWQEFGVTDFGKRLGVSFVHVPYRGGGPASQALATGDVAFSFATFASVMPMMQAGTVRGLAVSGAERSAEFPNLPTVAEALSLPGYRTLDWHALAGPAGLPADRRARIAAAFHHALARPELAQRLQAAGATPAPSTPQQMEDFVRAEIAHYTELARTTGIKGE